MNRDEERNISPVDQDAVTIRATEVSITQSGDETAEIRSDIEQTRAEMSETIDAIQERLSPSNLKEQVKDQVQEQFQEAKEMVREATIGRVEDMVQSAGDTVNEARYTIMDTIKENPIPAALVGIGLGWLFMNRSSSTPRRYSGRGSVRGSRTYYEGERYRPAYYDDERRYAEGQMYRDRRGYSSGYGSGQGSSTMERAQQTASNLAGRAQETASNVASSVSDTASSVASSVSDTASNVASQAQETAYNIADQAQYQAQRVEERFQRALRENPLAVGAVAIALGTAVGLAVPETRVENQWMGEARDNLLDRAQEVAQDTMEKVQRVAGEVTDEAKRTAKEEAKQQGLTS